MNTKKLLLVGCALFVSAMLNAQEVGIGTTAPGARLHVDAPAAYSGFLMKVTHGANTRLLMASDGALGLSAGWPFHSQLYVGGKGSIIAQGDYNVGNSLYLSGARTALIWYPDKAAFRVGRVTGNAWDESNIAHYSTVGGGIDNKANNYGAVVSGGISNVASGWYSTIGGGVDNLANGYYSVVSGGLDNSAYNDSSTVGGGKANMASGIASTVGGGVHDTAAGDYATVGGGFSNIAGGDYATISGGANNEVSGREGTIAGGASNQVTGLLATVGGGLGNKANDTLATVGGGYYNSAAGQAATIPGGYKNTADGDYSVAMGRGMKLGAAADRTFAFGYNDATTLPTITTPDAFLIGPNGNIIKVAIGSANPNARLSILNMGGTDNVSILSMSENEDAEFVFKGDFAGTGASGNRLKLVTYWGNTAMVWEGNGNVGIGVSNPAYTLEVHGDAAKTTGTAWTNISDRRLKDIHGDYEKGLKEILRLRPVLFSYKKNNPLHLPSNIVQAGFIAQEVREVFPECVKEREDGYLDLNISAINVAVINALQELAYENKALRDKIAKLETENHALRGEVQALQKTTQSLQQRMARMEAQVNR